MTLLCIVTPPSCTSITGTTGGSQERHHWRSWSVCARERSFTRDLMNIRRHWSPRRSHSSRRRQRPWNGLQRLRKASDSLLAWPFPRRLHLLHNGNWGWWLLAEETTVHEMGLLIDEITVLKINLDFIFLSERWKSCGL